MKKPSTRILSKLFLLIFGLLAGATLVKASTDYGPAIWRSAYSGHWYTSGNGHRFFVIHDMEGYYASTISYFQRSSTAVSATFLVNGVKDSSSDYPAGEITQMVREAYYPWLHRCWNTYANGTEHEGFVSNPAWFTTAMYNTSSLATRHECDKFGIAKDRNHVIGHDQKRISAWRTWMSNQGYSDAFITCNDHTDPGPYWDWTRYMDLIKGTVSTPSAPSSLTLSVVSASQINLTWVDHSGIETGFKVERATASAGPWTQIGTTAANDVTFSATGLTSGTLYYFRVRAYNATGNSPYSNTASATTKDTIPAAPTSLTATAVSNDQINLAWVQTMANEDGFRIYRSADNVTFTLIATVGINVTTYSSTGLLGNTPYWYKVAAYNTAGNSAFSNTATDTTAPQAPTSLTAVTGATYSQVNLAWTDNSNSEVGFKVERGTAAAGPFTVIATNAAGVRTYTDTGRAATTAYYYRVRSFNANGHSDYSNVASITTPNAPPVLAAIGDKTVAANSALTFTATATDPNASVVTTTFATFEGTADGTQEQMFRKPSNSSTTSGFIDTAATNYSTVKTGLPAGGGGTKALKAGWSFKTGMANYWVRFTTFGAPTFPNPTVAQDQIVRFKIYSSKALKVGVGVRETGTTAAYGANGGTTGAIEWVGVTNVVSGNPIPNRAVAANTWTTLSFNIPFEPARAFTGDGIVPQTGKGVLEHLILKGEGGTGAYTIWIDDIAVVAQNTLAYTLDAGAPAGATIERRTGKFAWTPTSGQVGTYNVTVRVTDQLGAVDFETIVVSVTGTGNTPPVLAAIGNKSVNEGSALTFTATATDVDAGQTKTFTLDAGAPAGASITTGGAFSWTPTEAQGPGSFPITVRVTDNGSPSSNDFETITVTVNEVNVAPALAVISNQTISEQTALNVTASATDADVPANTLTYSLAPGAPAGMSIGASSGAISWTPTEAQGPDVYPVTVIAKDNGSPNLSSSRSFNVTVNEANIAPVLNANTTVTTAEPITDFEAEEEGSYNGTVMFRQPSYSSTTGSFLDATPNETSVEAAPNFPDPDVNISSKVLHASFSFKTGTTNPWLRLTTFTTGSSYSTPNPTIKLGQRVRFDMYTDKAIKVALGVRETGTSAPIGANGGTTGSLEWVGATSTSGSPNPSRTITASNWTTVEFNLPNETITAFTGNGVLASGKGVLEHLVLAPAGGMGAYNVYLDNFQVVTVTTNLVVDTGGMLTFTNTATDADLPAQNLTFILDAGAPAGATIDPVTGVFNWSPTPAQSPSTNVISVRVTDDGPGALSDVENVTIIVNKINTPPRIGGFPDQTVEVASGEQISLQGEAVDDDVPADVLTFSLQGTPPAGASINPTTGLFTWTPTGGYSTNIITVRVTDNGVPPLYDEREITIIISATNAPPNISLGAAQINEPIIDYQSFSSGTANGIVSFRQPTFSSTTSGFLNTSPNITSVTNTYPAGHTSTRVMHASFNFKTGTTNPWLRLSTSDAQYVPNPTIDLGQSLRFDIWSDKALKVGLGVRETGTSAELGANGGVTGNMEFVGVTNTVSGSPFPNRQLAASNWTTLTFNLPSEPCRSMTGNGVLASGKGVLEHLALVPAGGTGTYKVYIDNFQVITTASLTNALTVKAGSTLTFTAAATDPDFFTGELLGFSLDADAPTNAAIDEVSGAFSWTPNTGFAGTTNLITVSVQDSPTNGSLAKIDSEDITVVVIADTIGVQSIDGGTLVAADETATLSWETVSGKMYQVQYKENLDDADWINLDSPITATSTNESVSISNSDKERFYRIIEVSSGAASE